MRWNRWLMTGLLAASCAACAQGKPGAPSEDGPVGTLSLSLTGTDSHGQQYRLRNAEFDISGYYYDYGSQTPIVTVSTETDPDSATISQRLAPGTYYVSLSNRLWYLERLTDHGPERVEHAVLLSSGTQYAYVYDRSTSNVYFTFGVDGELIDFRHGNLNIGILIERPDDDGGAPFPDQDATFPGQDAGL